MLKDNAEIIRVKPFYYLDKEKKLGICELLFIKSHSIAMITEMHENNAESISNSISEIVTMLYRELNIPNNRLMLLERWTDKDSYGRESGGEVTVFIRFSKTILYKPIEFEPLENEYVKQLFEL